MRKNCAIVKLVFRGLLIFFPAAFISAQETKQAGDGSAPAKVLPANDLPADYWSTAETPVYPRGVTLSDSKLWIVDSDAPGVWSIPWSSGDAASTPSKPVLEVVGSRYLRKIINRPFCALVHPQKGVLVGDAATREIYHVVPVDEADSRDAAIAGQVATPLNDGYLGIPMALAISPDQQTLYVGDAERRAVFALPLSGGKPELLVRVNARGLAWQDDKHLLAVTPDAEAVVRIDVEAKTSEPLVVDRPYGFPGGIAWNGDMGYVSDVYGRCIWSFAADGKTEKWFEGDPLVGPVGITATPTDVLVADPKTRQVYRIDRKTKQATALLAPGGP